MALHTKADFAKLCNLTTGNLTNYVKRGKVVMSGDFIDDSFPVNRDFIVKRKNKAFFNDIPATDSPAPKKLRLAKPDPIVLPLPNVQEPSEEGTEEEDSGDGGENIAGLEAAPADMKTMQSLQKKKLVVEIKKKEREIALLKLREEKLNAIVIPTDLVKVIFMQHSRSIATEFKNSIDGIITKIAKKKDLNLNEVAELRGELLSTINLAMDKSIVESKKNIGNIVREFTEKKEVGEHG